MSRVDAIRSELEQVGVDEFCSRRLYREDMPLKLMRNLQRARHIDERDIEREYRKPVTMTDARREVLEMLANGLSCKQIAFQLGRTEESVKDVSRAIIHYFDARNRAHAVHLAHQQGLL